MHSNYFDSTILGINSIGQGIANAVEGTHRTVLRALFSLARRLSLRLGAWLALAIKRTPATSTPSMAMCPSFSGSRRQRNQRRQPVVVVDAGTVGVC